VICCSDKKMHKNARVWMRMANVCKRCTRLFAKATTCAFLRREASHVCQVDSSHSTSAIAVPAGIYSRKGVVVPSASIWQPCPFLLSCETIKQASPLCSRSCGNNIMTALPVLVRPKHVTVTTYSKGSVMQHELGKVGSFQTWTQRNDSVD
jgi:hypothetical protein